MSIKIVIYISMTTFLCADTLSGFFGYAKKDVVIDVPKERNITEFKKIEVISKEESEESKNKKLLKKALENPREMTADQFQKAISYAKSRAVMQQTEEDIKNWTILNNFTIKNAESFQEKKRIVLLKNPNIDISGEFSKSGFSQQIKNKSFYEKQTELIHSLVDKIALFAFFGKEDNQIISSQERVLYFLKADFPKMTIIQIDITKESELFKYLKEKNTPSIWLAYRDKDSKAHWYRVVGGLSTRSEIIDNIDFIYTKIIKEEFEKND